MAERSTKIDIEDDDDVAETALLAAAMAGARASELKVPHEDMRAWLLKLADGDVSAKPPEPRKL
jgi:HSP20 family molecular chaperone IbpA